MRAMCLAAFWVTSACSATTADRAALAAAQASYAADLNACYETSKTYKDYEVCAVKADQKAGKR